MTLCLQEVRSRRDLRRFITFPEKLYANCPNWVHSLHSDEKNTLGDKNPALEFCERACYLALRDGEIVGRVAAIVNHKANERWKENVVRFGWIDFIDDAGVVRLLIDAVVAFGKARGCTTIKGPLGFSDLDKEGLMVEGFEHLAPFTVIYNYPYYGDRLEELGFVKDADWTQKIVEIPPADIPQLQYASLVEKRFGLHAVTDMSMKEMGRKYGMDLFHLINTSFAELYEYTPLSDRQIRSYLDVYLPILNKDFVAVIVDADDQVAGFAFCVPSLSKAFRKSKGRLFPFGFIPILRALRKNDTLEALMIGVLPQYQGKGASVLVFKYLLDSCHRYGITRMLANPQLEDNHKVQSVFDGIFENHEFMRRRSYVKPIE